MFDGSLLSLEEVVEHYASGGAQHPNQDPLVSGFTITNDEKKNLIAFLESLSDRAAIDKVKKRLQ
jgi:cytochrome c peroxidase